MFTNRGPSRFVVAVSFATVTAACASMTVPVEAGRLRGEEIGRAGVTSLYEALTRLRPDFLRGSGTVNARGEAALPSVRLNGIRAGAPDVLKLVQAAEVLDVRYRRPATALTIYGATCDCIGGVIEVTTRRAP